MQEISDPATITTPGPRLAEQRRAYGMTQQQVADRLGHHRNTIVNWERESAVDYRRSRLYLAALRALAREATR